METADHDSSGVRSASGTPDIADGAETLAYGSAGDWQLGEHAPALLAAEHWSLLAARSLIWSEAQSRATVFLAVLSASVISLALLADATGFGTQATTLAPMLLPVVFLVEFGVLATYRAMAVVGGVVVFLSRTSPGGRLRLLRTFRW